MIGKEMVEEKDATLSEVKNILEKRKKEGELSYEQKLAHDYSKEFGKLGVTKSRKLMDDLMGIEGIDSSLAVMIVDNAPEDDEDLKLLMERRRKKPSEADRKKILDLVAKAYK